MNLTQYEAQIDAFFDAIEPNEVVKLFMSLGYEFDRKEGYSSCRINSEEPKTGKSTELFDYHKLAAGWNTALNTVSTATGRNERYTSVNPQNVPPDDSSNFAEKDGIYKYPMAA